MLNIKENYSLKKNVIFNSVYTMLFKPANHQRTVSKKKKNCLPAELKLSNLHAKFIFLVPNPWFTPPSCMLFCSNAQIKEGNGCCLK